jgi:hypothetical protein
MKKLATTATVLALGGASLQAIYAPELSRIETGKPWTVAASLRGFYDDNINYRPSWETGQKGSWGFEVRPYVGLNLFPFDDATHLGLSYQNSSRWYEYRTQNPANSDWEFDHEFGLKFNHQFSPSYRLKVNDSFAYSTQPEFFGTIVGQPLRSDLTYYRNLGTISLAGELTPQFGFSATYNNTFYSYENATVATFMDHIEHGIPVDLRWKVQPELVALVGYAFGLVDYTSSGALPGSAVVGNARSYQTHAFYLGADYDMTAQLRGSLRVGAQYTSYRQAFQSTDSWTPYVDASLSYNYAVGSQVTAGFKHTISATDMYQVSAGNQPTLNQEASALYVQIAHQLTPKLTANLLGQYQWSAFNGGLYDGYHDSLFLLNLYFNYRINQFVSVEAGYEFNWLDSNVIYLTGANAGQPVRSYDRNMVYIGLRAQY